MSSGSTKQKVLEVARDSAHYVEIATVFFFARRPPRLWADNLGDP